ncbi:MAG: response regulator [Candidatus Omnitrophota bacterium]
MGNKKKILVIEDEKDIRRTLQLQLESEGFEVITASDGKEGLQKARISGADLVVLDLRLPELPGEEVCRELRKDEKHVSLPIIMLTAKGTDADWVRGLVIGANYYISKPYDLKDLLAAIDLLLKREQPAA